MKYLLDTCVVSELIKKQPNPQVVKWLGDQSEFDLCISVLTLGEVEKGIARLEKSEKRDRLETWLRNDLLERFGERVIPFTAECALVWGATAGVLEREDGNVISVIDGQIAATANVFKLTLVTRNTDDFQGTGIKVFNPWS